MEKFVEYRDKARHHVRVADHMLTMTYPLVKDPKLLLSVLENIFLAMTSAMASVLYYERVFKRIPPFHDTFESKFSSFKIHIVRQRNIDLAQVRFIAQIKELVEEHKNAATEFRRKNTFVIANDQYRLKTLSEAELKKYLKKTKELVHELLQLVKSE